MKREFDEPRRIEREDSAPLKASAVVMLLIDQSSRATLEHHALDPRPTDRARVLRPPIGKIIDEVPERLGLAPRDGDRSTDRLDCGRLWHGQRRRLVRRVGLGGLGSAAEYAASTSSHSD